MTHALKLLISLVFLSSSAQAQYILDRFEKPTHDLRAGSFKLNQATPKPADPVLVEQLTNRAKALALILVEQYKKILQPLEISATCEAHEALALQMKALRVGGKGAEALEIGETCLKKPVKGLPTTRLLVLLETVQAAVSEFKFARGMELCTQAIASEFSAAPDYRSAVLECANLALKTEYQEQVATILTNEFKGEQTRLAQGTLELWFLGQTPLVKEDEANLFLQTLLLTAAPRLRSYIHLNQIQHLDRNRYKYNDMLVYLEKNVGEILDPSEWIDNAYDGFYHQEGTDTFRLAQIIYDAYLPFVTKFSWLPIETNTQNYSEIYSTVCQSKVAHGDAFETLAEYRKQYLLGIYGAPDLLGVLLDLSQQNPATADILDFSAHLQTRAGAVDADDQAAATYFEAHQACGYYNRSHWGLVNIIRRKRHHAFSDYEKRLQLMKETVEKLPNMDALSSYVLNWESLDDDARLRAKFSLRFWAPHIEFLAASRQKVYIKRGFELLSTVPYMSSIRDMRITYSGDNRLWDDVRGLGGSLVIVDLEEMMDGPFGVYNLAGHEVGHQFHSSLPAGSKECIENLYARAKERNVFADPYAKTNSHEYFAQGVGYYMWPPDSPKRFGLNRQWLLDNDPDLDAFLTSIAEAQDVYEIVCPLAK
jgi:hypothetical protein